MKFIYKTTVESSKGDGLISIRTPDTHNNWELHSVSVGKKKLYYHWKLPQVNAVIINNVQRTTTFSSSDDDFQKSSQMVLDSQEEVKNVDNQ